MLTIQIMEKLLIYCINLLIKTTKIVLMKTWVANIQTDRITERNKENRWHISVELKFKPLRWYISSYRLSNVSYFVLPDIKGVILYNMHSSVVVLRQKPDSNSRTQCQSFTGWDQELYQSSHRICHLHFRYYKIIWINGLLQVFTLGNCVFRWRITNMLKYFIIHYTLCKSMYKLVEVSN